MGDTPPIRFNMKMTERRIIIYFRLFTLIV